MSSHYFLIRAYDLLDAAAVQPLTSLQVVLAAIIGSTVFGETLSINTMVGSAIVVSAGINALLVLFAGRVSGFLNRSPRWINAQRYLMSSVLGLLALRILSERKPA